MNIENVMNIYTPGVNGDIYKTYLNIDNFISY